VVIISTSEDEGEDKPDSHDDEDKPDSHEDEDKPDSHDDEDKPDSHDDEDNPDSHEDEDETSSDDGDIGMIKHEAKQVGPISSDESDEDSDGSLAEFIAPNDEEKTDSEATSTEQSEAEFTNR
jgi:spermidine synthase